MSEEGKVCSKCRQWKPLEGFSINAAGRLGRNSVCKSCVSTRQKAKRSTPDGREEFNRKNREYYHNTPESRRRRWERVKERLSSDPSFASAYRAYDREYKRRVRSTPEGRTAANDNAARYYRRRYGVDPEYTLGFFIRGSVRRTILGKSSGSIGYTPRDLRLRLECQFQPGMSWDNYGEWHVDHKKPVSAFLAQGVTDPKIINMLCNLQPLWAAQNLRKHAKWSELLPANDNELIRAAS